MSSLFTAIYAGALIVGIVHWILVWSFGSTVSGEPMKVYYRSRIQMIVARTMTAFLGGFGLAGLVIGSTGLAARDAAAAIGACTGVVLAFIAWLSADPAKKPLANP